MKERFRLSKYDLLAVAALIILVLTFLNKGALMKGVFFGADEIASDLVHFSYPYREFYADEYLRKGIVPVWNQYLGSGLPVLAEAQTGIFYLPTVILYLLLPTAAAFNYLIIFCFLSVAIGTYVYSRTVGINRQGALFSATIFVLSGYMVGHLRHVPIITAMAVGPWMFWSAEKMLRTGKIGWMITLSGLIAMSFFAGHLTTTYGMVLFLGVYFLGRFQGVFRKGREDWKLVLMAVGAVILGLLISAVQLIPSLELVPYSTRTAIGDSPLGIASSFDPRFWLMMVRPYLFGDPSIGTWDMAKNTFWENIGYVGVIPLILGLWGGVSAIRKKEDLGLTWGICLVLGIILVMGQATLVYGWFWDWVPGFAATRIPGRFLLFVDFFLAVLAGWQLGKIKRKLTVAIIFIVTLGDLFIFGYHFNTVIPQSYFKPPKSVEFIKKDPDLFRIRSAARSRWAEVWEKSKGWGGDLGLYQAQKEALPQDYNLLFRVAAPSLIYEMTGHFSLFRAGALDAYSVRQASETEDATRAAILLGMENVKYLVTEFSYHQAPGFSLAAEIPVTPQDFSVHILKNKYYLPRAYYVPNARNFNNGDELLGEMAHGQFNPDKEVFLESGKRFPEGTGSGRVVVNSYKDTRVVIDCEATGSGFLVLSDSYYPGWKATVDGKTAEILKANYNYRALFLPSGKHRVVFWYDPWSVKLGAAVSAAALLGAILILQKFR